MNRSLSIRSKRDQASSSRHRFSMASFRSMQLPVSSRKLNKLIKSENSAIDAHEAAGRERISIAAQLSDWGESTEDDAVSDISDRLGVLLAEIGEQEDGFSMTLEDYRNLLKHIRDTETSVQPSRDLTLKVLDELEKLKYKEPGSQRLVTLEQELVRVEAQNLVAEAQLTNVTRAKFKQAYDIHLAAVIERAEKQIILARHARRLLNCLDDTPVVPGDPRRPYEHEATTRQILDDAEKELSSWERTCEPIHSGAAGLSSNLLGTANNNAQQDVKEIAAPEPNGSERGATLEEPQQTLAIENTPGTEEYSSVGEGPSSTVEHSMVETVQETVTTEVNRTG